MEQQLPNPPVSPTHVTHQLNAPVRLSDASESPTTSANKRAQLIHWLINFIPFVLNSCGSESESVAVELSSDHMESESSCKRP